DDVGGSKTERLGEEPEIADHGPVNDGHALRAPGRARREGDIGEVIEPRAVRERRAVVAHGQRLLAIEAKRETSIARAAGLQIGSSQDTAGVDALEDVAEAGRRLVGV